MTTPNEKDYNDPNADEEVIENSETGKELPAFNEEDEELNHKNTRQQQPATLQTDR